MTTTPLSVTQSGYEDVGDVWVDTGEIAILGLYAGFLAGMRWLVPLKGVRYSALTLTLDRWAESANPGGTGTLSVYAVRQNSATAFSTGFWMPRNRGRQLVATVTGTISAGNNIVLSIPLNDAQTGQALETLRTMQFGADPNNFGLIFDWTGPDIESSISLVATYEEAFTGLSGPFRAMGRADECPKCGGKSTRDTWVKDRYLDRLVCPRCYDPLSTEDVDGRRGSRVGREREGIGEG
jgi:hypothetical protein